LFLRNAIERVEEEQRLSSAVEVDEFAYGKRYGAGVDAAFDEVAWQASRVLRRPAGDVHAPLDRDVVLTAFRASDMMPGIHSGFVSLYE
jgi:hypothetical protein